MLFSLIAAFLVAGCATLGHCEDPKVFVTFKAYHPFTTKPDDFVYFDNDCNGGKFKGKRSMVPNDPSLIRIENCGKKFAGSQTGIYVDEVAKTSPNAVKFYENNPQVIKDEIDGKAVYLMTAYIHDPETICDVAAPGKSEYLYIQLKNGEYLKVDRKSGPTEGWYLNPCVPQMGDHYREVTPKLDASCDNWNPSFLLYQANKNIGYGWNFPGDYKNKNFENVARNGFLGAISPMPNCVMDSFDESKGYTSQHVYLHQDPSTIPCPTQ